MTRRNTPTANDCPACHSQNRAGCRLCGGTGFVSRDVLARYEAERKHRITGQIVEYEKILDVRIGQLTVRLKELKDMRALADTTTCLRFIDEARALAREFEVVKPMPQGDPRRTKAVETMIDFNGRAYRFMRGER